MLSDHARRALETRGHIDQRGIGRTVQSRLCRKCGRPVMVGTDAMVTGVSVAADPAPLTVFGELAAVMDGCATFDLTFTTRYEIDYRDQWRIEGVPAGTGRSDVVAEHRCGRFNTAIKESHFVGRISTLNSIGEPPF